MANTGQMWPPAGVGGGHTIQEDGTALTQRSKLNFVGTAVTATDDSGNDRTDVTISGGGTTITSGSATPTSGTGNPGEYYLDSDDRILYGPKSTAVIEYVTIPTGSIGTSSGQANVSMKFRFLANGYVHGVRVFIPGSVNKVGWGVYLYGTGGTLLASKYPVNPVDDWNQFTFDSPVSVVTATTYYVATYSPGYWGNTGSFAGLTSGNVQCLGEGVEGTALLYNLSGPGVFPNNSWGGNSTPVSPVFSTSVDATTWPVALRSVLPGGTTDQILAKSSSTDYALKWATAGSSGHTIQDEGSAMTARTGLDFIGPAVAVTDDSANSKTKVTISTPNMIVLGPSDAVPGGTPAGTVIVRTT